MNRSSASCRVGRIYDDEAWFMSLNPIAWRAATVRIVCGIMLAALPAPTGWGLAAQQQAIADPEVSFVWDGVPLRDALQSLQMSSGVQIFLDRRIDPDQTVNYLTSSRRLSESLTEFAQPRGMGVGRVGALFYVGPREAAEKLATLAVKCQREVRALAANDRRRWLRQADVVWEELAEPRQILDQIAVEFRIELDRPFEVPHDLWDAGRLADIAAAPALLLVLVGFEQTIQINQDGSARVIEMPAAVTVQENYPANQFSASSLKALRNELPPGAVTERGPSIIVDAPYSVHRSLQQSLQPAVNRRAERGNHPAKRGEQRYTLRVRNQPLRKLLPLIAAQWGVALRSEISAEKFDQLVTFEVELATREELLKAMLEPVQLRAELQPGQQLVVKQLE
jgi:hypothetical protein